MSGHVWSADIDIDAALALRLVNDHFHELCVETIEPFGSGWDNAAFVNGSIVFRFPRRRSVAHLIEREIAVLPLLMGKLPLPISAPQYGATASAAFGFAFAGYQRIAGRTACAVPLDDDGRTALAASLGRFLRALHRIDAGPLLARGLPADEIGRLDPIKRLALARDRLAALASAGVDGSGAVAWLAANPPQPIDGRRRVVVHGGCPRLTQHPGRSHAQRNVRSSEPARRKEVRHQ